MRFKFFNYNVSINIEKNTDDQTSKLKIEKNQIWYFDEITDTTLSGKRCYTKVIDVNDGYVKYIYYSEGSEEFNIPQVMKEYMYNRIYNKFYKKL